MNINLDDFIPGCINFRWREALWLPTWAIYCFPTPEQQKNIIKVASVMDAIRNRFGKPIQVTSWLRPSRYNEWKFPHGVGGAKASSHVEGKAVDFKVMTISCDEVRQELIPLLEHLNIRMEDLPGSNWVHIDCRSPGSEGKRFFMPSSGVWR